MKKITTFKKALLLSIFALMGLSRTSSAVTFTAAANGNWSTAATWGGSGPSFNVGAGESIVIPPGITVTLDTNATINGSLAAVTVNGTLSGTTSLMLTNGTLSGAGTISIHDLTVGASGLLSVTGRVIVEEFTNSSAVVVVGGSLTVDSIAILNAGVVEINSAADTINLASNVTINIAGGTLAVGVAAIVNLAGTFNLSYSGSASAIGIESLLPGLKNITIDMPSSSSQITLSAGLAVTGTLSLQQGILVLNGNNLTIKDSIYTSASASIMGSISSIVTIDGSGNVGSIGFNAGGASVAFLNINIGDSGSVSLTSDLTVADGLALDSGMLNVGSNMLTLTGAVTRIAGNISTTVNSGITINGVLALDSLMIAGNVGDLTINTFVSSVVLLRSDIIVNGALTVSSGTLVLNGHNLTIDGTISAGGSGAIAGNINSSITVNGTGSVGNIFLSASADTLNNLTVNIGGSGSISFGSNVVVAGMLSSGGGSLDISGNSLTIDGTVSASGTGSISVNSSSNIIINGAGSVGTIVLKAGAQTFNNLTLNISSNGSVIFASDATVTGTLSLTKGKVDIGNNDLTIAASGSIQGDSSVSYVITGDSGSLVMTVDTGGVASIFTVGTQAGFAPVKITNHNAASASGVFKVNAHLGVFANGSAGADLSATTSAVNTSWDIKSSIVSNANVDLEMFWDASMEVNGFDRTHAYISHYTNAAWDVTANGQATADINGSFSIKRTGILSFSPFAVFDRNSVTGIAEVAANPTMLLYPNPASGIINISVDKLGRENYLKVYDALGNQMMSYLLTQTLTSIDVSNLAAGVYFLSINNASNSMFVKN